MWIEIALLFICFYFLWQHLKKPSDYPPGYWGLPLIGYIPFGRKGFNEHLFDLHKKYGDVTVWRMGGQLMVFIYDYKLIKEVLVSQDFIDRPENILFRFLADGKNLGLVGSNGLLWHHGRRFTLRHLRDLGMGKSRLESAVQHEALELVEDFKNRAGKPTTIPHSLAVAVLNVIWQMVASKRYSLDDSELHKFEDMIQIIQKNVGRMVIPAFLPLFNYVVPRFLARRIIKADFVDKVRCEFGEFLKKIILAHEEKLDPNNPCDYIDEYLIEMKKQENDEATTMSIDNLLICVSDLFGAGSDTIQTTLRWLIFYLANYPDVQKRLQGEIDEVFPKMSLPTLADKSRLSYTEAVIHEVHRHASMIPLSVIHVATRDTEINNYKIPKGAFINPVTLWVHHDPKYWDCPNVFMPERFLDAAGKFIHPKEGFMPFGSGKRQCIGEPLARMELIIFVTTLVQSLQFSPPPGKIINLLPSPGNPFANSPQHDQEILITIR